MSWFLEILQWSGMAGLVWAGWLARGWWERRRERKRYPLVHRHVHMSFYGPVQTTDDTR